MPLRTRVRCESLEDRSTPATFTVTSLADAGAGTLRAAVALAQANPDADTIVFDPAVRGGTVNLTTFDTGLGTTQFGPSAFYVTTPITIQGTGETIRRSAAAPFRLFSVLNAGRLALSDVELSGGFAKGGNGLIGGGGAGGFGGAVYNAGHLTLRRVTVSGNTAEGGNGGGAVGQQVAGGGGGVGQSATDTESADGGGPNGGNGFGQVLTGGFGGGGAGASEGDAGHGGFGGGGGGNDSGGEAGNGGFGGGGGASDGVNSNGFGGFGGGDADVATGGGGGAGMGGGVFNFGGTVTVENSTFSGNSAVAGGGGSDNAHGLGGGLFSYNGTVTVTSSTLTGNVALDGGRQMFVLSDGGRGTGGVTATVANSILGQADTAGTDFRADDIDGGTGTITGTGNLIRTATGFTGTTVSTADPRLAPLANNGGLSRTHLPAAGSPALDALAPTATTLLTDQRFRPRVSNGRLDIGAVEVVPPAAPVVPVPVPPVVPAPIPTVPPVVPPAPRPQNYVVGVGSAVQLRAGDGTLLAAYPVFQPSFTGGVNVAYGDLTGDGVPDVVAAAGPGGGPHVLVFDGATGAVRASFYAFDPAFAGGVSVAVGDADGDGRAELVVGAGPGGGPHVKVFDVSGPQVALRKTFFAYAPGFTGGVTVAAGSDRLVTSAGPGGGPHIKVFRGSTDELLFSFYAYVPQFPGGASVAVGDVTGDGVADVIVAADATGGPHVTVWDGSTGALRLSFFGYQSVFPGGVNLAVRDVTGDGVDDYLFGAGPTGGPHVLALDGRTFQLLGSLFAVSADFFGGVTVG